MTEKNNKKNKDLKNLKNKKNSELPNLPPNVKVVKITSRSIFTTLILIVLAFGIWDYSKNKFSDIKTTINSKISITELVAKANSGSYERITYTDKGLVRATAPIAEIVENGNIVKTQTIDEVEIGSTINVKDIGLIDNKANTPVDRIETGILDIFSDFLPSIISTILMVVLFVFLISRMAGGGPMGNAMNFIKSRAKVYDPDWEDKVTFADVAGSEEEKKDLEEVVDFLKNPEKYKKLWAKIPRGILLQGPPGTGKTLLARAVAGESGVPFFSISGSEFVEMFVGVGASRVRDLFQEAREKSPSIIFIDEIDAIGKKRSPWIGGGHDEREQTLNQILTEMDGFGSDTNVIVMAATNRADVLDKALLRPGRFDRKVTINLPMLEDRKKILWVHKKWKPFADNVNWDKIAGITVGFSGAEIGNLLNESAILAGRKNQEEITEDLIQNSVEKVIMGNEKKSLKMTEHEKYLTSVHEVGHALVGKMLAHTDPVHKISILPRGGAGGVTWFLPEKDRTYVSYAKYLDELACLYGGRVAEEIFFGRDYITTGASSDIERATDMARAMVMRYGFDSELGAENFVGKETEGNYLGGGSSQNAVISEDTRKIIDQKVKQILSNAYQTAYNIVKSNFDLHEKISKYLYEKEEMTEAEFDEYFVGMTNVPEKIMK